MTKLFRVWLVGGAVRDALMGVESDDFDFAMECLDQTLGLEAAFDAMCDSIRKQGGVIFETRPQDVTVRARIPGVGGADFVLCRKEVFEDQDSRHGTVSLGTIFDDLLRRDIGFNAIAQDWETKEFFDPFNGRQDLLDKVVRVPDENILRTILDDPVRLVRFVRFGARFGFEIDEKIFEVVMAHDEEILEAFKRKVSAERIQKELEKMFRKSDNMLCWKLCWKMFFGVLFDHVMTAGGKMWFLPTLKAR